MDYICIGKIVNTHALKGEVRIISNFEYKDRVFNISNKLYIGKDKCEEVIETYRKHKNYDMVKFKNIDNINDVLKYKGLNIYINKDDVKLENNCYFDEDLIGLKVLINVDDVGVIKKIDYMSKQPLFVVKCEKKDCLIPYVSDIIEKINLNEGYIAFKNIKGLI